MQTHGSMGPSCAVADVRDDRATVWTASQATHKYREAYATMLGLPQNAVRLIYLDGAGCYGMNGHDDAGGRRDAVIARRRQAGARAVVARRRARLGSERSAAAPCDRKRARCRRQDRGVANGHVAAEGDGQPAERAAAGARSGGHRAAARHLDGPYQPEWRADVRRCRIRKCRCIGTRRRRCGRRTSARRARSPIASRSKAWPTSSPPRRRRDAYEWRLAGAIRSARRSRC